MNAKYYLKIFQLEAYRPTRFLKWVLRHHFRTLHHPQEAPVWTPKARLLHRLSWTILLTVVFLSALKSLLLGLLLGLLFFFNWYLLIIAAWACIRPYELYNRVRVKGLIRSKIFSLERLCVIGITGSYGKTSTKMVLQQLLPDCLMTPKSYNTLFGIWKVVDYELSERFRYFICEMGAYKRGDVREFCELTVPHVGVLTGINEQHLERFGSIENTTLAKFEITQYLRTGAIGVVNLDNQRIREHLSLAPVPLIGYSIDGYSDDRCEYVVTLSDWKVEQYRTRFRIRLREHSFEGTTALIGRAHLSNVLCAFTVAQHLGEPPESLLKRIAELAQVPHRLECRRTEGYTLLDNSYSSNPTAFKDSLDALSKFEGRKVLITPGLVELGAETRRVHEELGELAAGVCDEIVLVGDSDKTKALRQGMMQKGFADSSVRVLRNRGEMLEYLKSKAQTGEVVLIENDLPDQYL